MKRTLSIVLTLIVFAAFLTVPAFALQNGSRGSDVKWHQKTLNFLGFDCGEADGVYGKMTTDATKAFQKANGLTEDGIAGSKTLTAEEEAVRDIQTKLTALEYGKLTADGLPGSKTVEALKAFQKASGLTQSGIYDSSTARKLNDAYSKVKEEREEVLDEFRENCLESWTLPLKVDFKSITGSRKFGSSRDDGKRSHAGVDFVADAGTEVYAMTAGTVLQVYTFYESTKAVEVRNEDGSILRYCEISPSVKKGDKVEQGELIGTIMKADGGTEMLHLELYFGDAKGDLTQRTNTVYTYVDSKKFQRRSDLMDPTFLKDLDALE